ncbi:MAG: hypothetical protein ACYTGN_15545 [Planctomycetota bacterium]|jgi:hypothetical protein
MRILFVAILFVAVTSAQEELTPYSLQEIDGFLGSFKRDAKNKKTPEADANTSAIELGKAYKYLVSKEKKGEASGDEIKYKTKIVKAIGAGLKLRKRPLVTLQCAQTLGEIGDMDAAKPLAKWMENTVLDAKSPNPQWVEYGFVAMARIGSQDSSTIDLIVKYAGGKHPDTSVAPLAMKAAYHWRALSGKNRRLLYDKILQHLQGQWSLSRGSDAKKRGGAEKRYNLMKAEGLEALFQLSGHDKKFKDPAEANEFWKLYKRKKWQPYVGVEFRVKKAPAKKVKEGDAKE